MVWPTLGSRKAKEQNRTDVRIQVECMESRKGRRFTFPLVLMPLNRAKKVMNQASVSDSARSHMTGPITSIPELSRSTRRLQKHIASIKGPFTSLSEVQSAVRTRGGGQCERVVIVFIEFYYNHRCNKRWKINKNTFINAFFIKK